MPPKPPQFLEFRQKAESNHWGARIPTTPARSSEHGMTTGSWGTPTQEMPPFMPQLFRVRRVGPQRSLKARATVVRYGGALIGRKMVTRIEKTPAVVSLSKKAVTLKLDLANLERLLANTARSQNEFYRVYELHQYRRIARDRCHDDKIR